MSEIQKHINTIAESCEGIGYMKCLNDVYTILKQESDKIILDNSELSLIEKVKRKNIMKGYLTITQEVAKLKENLLNKINA